MGRELSYFISSLIKWAIFFGILYLIFTNFGTFLIILFVLVAIAYYLIYQFKKKIKESTHNQSFKFTFNGQEFTNNDGFSAHNFNFEQFEQQFRRGNFNTQPQFGEIEKAKEFFGFTSTPTKEEIKKRYKELARKYHPDINDQDDTMMQQLNHYKDVLMKTYGN